MATTTKKAAYREFCDLVRANGWTLEQIRFAAPPTAELMETLDEFGLNCWERFVTRYEKELAKAK